MQTMLLEPLRWQERSARVTIVSENGGPKAYFQITSARDVAGMAKGRPVEELPRILGMLSPAHHLVSAMALDKLFKVEPPDLAVNMRKAFLQAQFIRHHLRKLYFFLSSSVDPFRDYQPRETPATGPHAPHQILDEIMHCVALAQEAATILGGRADHPLAAVAGGVSRFLKDPHYGRLAEIAGHCLEFATRLASLFREKIFVGSGVAHELLSRTFHPMQSLAMSNGSGNVVVRSPEGTEIDQISQNNVFEKIALHQEAWSYEPFAFLKDKGWSTLEPENSGSLYFVGPLARLNGGDELQQPLAEEERQSLVEALGPFPHFSISAAYWSLLVEAIQAAEKMVELCSQDKLTGPAIRTMPSETGDAGYAALESPEGLIAHRYRTDNRALVEEVEILDTSAENNALLCFLVRKTVEESLARDHITEEIKSGIEISLLPF
jgi:coenzyme F420-reducing hydrogenase alpha subunit